MDELFHRSQHSLLVFFVVVFYWVGLSRITSEIQVEKICHIYRPKYRYNSHTTQHFIWPRQGLGRVLIFAKCDRSDFWPLSLSPPTRLRVLRTAGHGGRHNLQPADNSLLHPPRSVRPAEMVPLLCTAQQEGSGQRLDRRWKWQMAVDPGKSFESELFGGSLSKTTVSPECRCSWNDFTSFLCPSRESWMHRPASEAALQPLKMKKNDVFLEIPSCTPALLKSTILLCCPQTANHKDITIIDHSRL